MKRTLGFSLAAAFVLACGDYSPTSPQTAMSDGAHEDAAHPGNPDFFFLPPMVRDPSGHPDFEAGKFNGSLAPTVRICELAETDAVNLKPETLCSDPQPTGFPIVFTTTSGPGSETIRVNPIDEYYIANWHTDLFALSTGKFYRIRVSVGSFGLGFADVDVVNSGRELKNVQTGELIGLVDGRTLPIKFRIEEDALCTPEPGAQCNASSETVDLGDNQVDQVELRDETTGDQIGVLTIPPQDPPLPPGSTITFTLQQCERLNTDIPQFGDCLRITSDPPLTQVAGADGLSPPATISLCRTTLIGNRNPLITVHRQDEETGQVFALPHADDDCEDVAGPVPGPAWDVGQEPAGDSPFTSLFRNALPAKMTYVNPADAERSAAPDAVLATKVQVTDANGGLVDGARVTFQVTDGLGSLGSSITQTSVLSVAGIAEVPWTLGLGANTLMASGHGIATPTTNGPAEGVFDPFWPGLHVDGVVQNPVLLQTGMLAFFADGARNGTETIDLHEGGSVDLRDDTGNQIGVLSIPPQSLPDGSRVTFTLTQCEKLDTDIPQFGDCLRITSDPPLTDVTGADGLSPPATISICRTGLIGTRNSLITLHRQDEETGEVFALPHADDDCEDVVIQGPAWDVGQEPAGESPFTSLFRNALPVKMDYVNAADAERSATTGTALPTQVRVTDANGGLVDGARVTFQVTGGLGSINATSVLTVKGLAQVTWTLGTGANTLVASGHGIASPTNNGPAVGFDPFWPGLPVVGVVQQPVLLGTGTLRFTATGTAPSSGVINFEKYPDGSATCSDCAVGNEYAAQGVVFSFRSELTSQTQPHILLNSNNPERASNHDVTSPPSDGGGRWVGTTVMTFSGAPGRVRFEARVNNTISEIPVAVFDASGAQVSATIVRSNVTVYNPGTVDFRQETITVGHAGGIGRIELSGGGPGGFLILLDDLVINPPPEIDGVLNTGEWRGAAETALTVNVPGGTTPATLFVKNDRNNLYLALKFARSSVDADNLLNFEFDNNNNGTGPENGDDYITFSFNADPNAAIFSDAFRSTCSTLPAGCVTNDRADGAGAFRNADGFSVYELSHPLNSGEVGKDFALTPPTVIGMLLQLHVGTAHTRYPAGTFPTYVQINISNP